MLGAMTEGPRLKVVRGTPTAEEVAALVGVLLSRPAPEAPAAPVSRWARAARPSPGPRPGPDAWRASL